MSSFRKSYVRWVKTQGRYENGLWIEGETNQAEFQASIQPLGSFAMNALSSQLQGRHISSAVKIYTEEVLNVSGENDNNGDEIEFQGKRYLIVARDEFQSDVISHYRYQAVRVNNAS